MNDHHTHTDLLDVDEAWVADWAAEGIAALERYLAKQAAFADYLRAQGDLDCDDGHRRQVA